MSFRISSFLINRSFSAYSQFQNVNPFYTKVVDCTGSELIFVSIFTSLN